MVTYVQFVQPPDAPFSFQATLDGATYNVSVPFNIFSQRWYVLLADQFGNIIFNLPLIESPPLQNLTSLTWNSGGIVTAVTGSSLPYPIGTIAMLTIYGATPIAYNGLQECVIQDETTFTYSLGANPGQAAAVGSWVQDIPITAGYFISTLIWRPSTGNFETSP